MCGSSIGYWNKSQPYLLVVWYEIRELKYQDGIVAADQLHLWSMINFMDMLYVVRSPYHCSISLNYVIYIDYTQHFLLVLLVDFNDDHINK